VGQDGPINQTTAKSVAFFPSMGGKNMNVRSTVKYGSLLNVDKQRMHFMEKFMNIFFIFRIEKERGRFIFMGNKMQCLFDYINI
jgi:hypothetical protein